MQESEPRPFSRGVDNQTGHEEDRDEYLKFKVGWHMFRRCRFFNLKFQSNLFATRLRSLFGVIES